MLVTGARIIYPFAGQPAGDAIILKTEISLPEKSFSQTKK
jgi:hypothetical protein